MRTGADLRDWERVLEVAAGYVRPGQRIAGRKSERKRRGKETVSISVD
jgi:hypothetical protein